jgi:hypothetical protein
VNERTASDQHHLLTPVQGWRTKQQTGLVSVKPRVPFKTPLEGPSADNRNSKCCLITESRHENTVHSRHNNRGTVNGQSLEHIEDRDEEDKDRA